MNDFHTPEAVDRGSEPRFEEDKNWRYIYLHLKGYDVC